jgi:hypothetical protein
MCSNVCNSLNVAPLPAIKQATSRAGSTALLFDTSPMVSVRIAAAALGGGEYRVSTIE